MKYFVAFPITFDCNLHCYYCFHEERFLTGYSHPRQFTLENYCRFRDTHLQDATDIIVHFHGGEPFVDTNIAIVCNFMHGTSMEQADLLTNGIQPRESYERILKYRDRIHRVGFTFHRKIIGGTKLVDVFQENLRFLHQEGVPVYVKELLFVDLRDEIIAAKRLWEVQGITFRIQDFKGCDRGRSFEEFEKYSAADYLYLDSEYKHAGPYCSCMKGYKNVLIRGGWHDGDVLACFEDPTVVGSVLTNEYNPSYIVCRDFERGRIDVRGVPKLYRGTYERDLYVPGQCGSN